MNKKIADLGFDCGRTHECTNVLCFVRQMKLENRSPWLFKTANVERNENERLRPNTIYPDIRGDSHPTIGITIRCESIQIDDKGTI